jgi:hypothetical protein
MSSSSSEEGEASPCRLVASSKRKGKEIAMEPAPVPHRAATGGFMADARHSGVPLAGEGRIPGRRRGLTTCSLPRWSHHTLLPRSTWMAGRRFSGTATVTATTVLLGPPPVLCQLIWLDVASISWRHATSPLLAGIPLAVFVAGGRVTARSSAGGIARWFLRLGVAFGLRRPGARRRLGRARPHLMPRAPVALGLLVGWALRRPSAHHRHLDLKKPTTVAAGNGPPSFNLSGRPSFVSAPAGLLCHSAYSRNQRC